MRCYELPRFIAVNIFLILPSWSIYQINDFRNLGQSFPLLRPARAGDGRQRVERLSDLLSMFWKRFYLSLTMQKNKPIHVAL